jgi:hypothetical protein
MASSNNVPISVDVVGLFIGPGGENIKKMNIESGAKISVGRNTIRGGRFKLVSVRGTRSARQTALIAVKNWIGSEMVQEILNNQTKEKVDYYARRKKMVVVEKDGWNTIVGGKGTPDERINSHFYHITKKVCVSKLKTDTQKAVGILNKRTGFNWGNIAIADDVLDQNINKTIKNRYHLKY